MILGFALIQCYEIRYPMTWVEGHHYHIIQHIQVEAFKVMHIFPVVRANNLGTPIRAMYMEVSIIQIISGCRAICVCVMVYYMKR